MLQLLGNLKCINSFSPSSPLFSVSIFQFSLPPSLSISLSLTLTSRPLTSSYLFLLLSGPGWLQSVLLGIVVLLAYRLEFTDTFPVHTQGFFCYDSAYAKPYPGPEAASRAPPALIYALVTAGPTLTVRWCGSGHPGWMQGVEPPRRQEGQVGAGGALALKARKTPSWSCPQILLGELARAFFPAPPSASPVSGDSTIVSGACCRFSPPLRRLVRFLGEKCSLGSV